MDIFEQHYTHSIWPFYFIKVRHQTIKANKLLKTFKSIIFVNSHCEKVLKGCDLTPAKHKQLQTGAIKTPFPCQDI